MADIIPATPTIAKEVTENFTYDMAQSAMQAVIDSHAGLHEKDITFNFANGDYAATALDFSGISTASGAKLYIIGSDERDVFCDPYLKGLPSAPTMSISGQTITVAAKDFTDVVDGQKIDVWGENAGGTVVKETLTIDSHTTTTLTVVETPTIVDTGVDGSGLVFKSSTNLAACKFKFTNPSLNVEVSNLELKIENGVAYGSPRTLGANLTLSNCIVVDSSSGRGGKLSANKVIFYGSQNFHSCDLALEDCYTVPQTGNTCGTFTYTRCKGTIDNIKSFLSGRIINYESDLYLDTCNLYLNAGANPHLTCSYNGKVRSKNSLFISQLATGTLAILSNYNSKIAITGGAIAYFTTGVKSEYSGKVTEYGSSVGFVSVTTNWNPVKDTVGNYGGLNE